MTREEALALVHEYTKNQNLIKHMLAVEAAMRAYARRFGENEETWGLAGLLHDFDYENIPIPSITPRKGTPLSACRFCARAASPKRSAKRSWDTQPIRASPARPGWPRRSSRAMN